MAPYHLDIPIESHDDRRAARWTSPMTCVNGWWTSSAQQRSGVPMRRRCI